MKILVTGGAGFIGSHVTEAIAKAGISDEIITVTDNLAMGSMSNISEVEGASITVVEQDVTDYDRLSLLLAKQSVDTIIHLAVTPLVYSLREPVVGFDHIVKMQQNLLECQRKGLFGRLISFSTSEVYGGMGTRDIINEEDFLCPATPYAAAKAAADVLALSYYNSFGADVTIVRPFNNYGPRKRVLQGAGIIPTAIQRLSQGLPVQLFGGGTATRDFVFVEDTAHVVVRILKAEQVAGEIFHVASGVARSMREVVEDIAEIMGIDALIEDHPARQGDVKGLRGSMQKTREQLGMETLTQWEIGLKKCVDYYSVKR